MRYKAIRIGLLLLAAFGAGMITGVSVGRNDITAPEIITRIDTVRIVTPEPVVVKYIGREVVAVARADMQTPVDSTADSIVVELPRTQALYIGEDWRAYVSGINPRLDSLHYQQKHTLVPTRRQRWSVGIQAGAGITPAGVQPYIGVGICFRIL